MRAVRLIRPGSFAGLDLTTSDIPSGTPRDVAIRLHAASLNYRDGLITKGQYPGFVRDKLVPLSDGAGEVIAVGSAVTRAAVGDRVVIHCLPRWIDGAFDSSFVREGFGVSIDGMLSDHAVVDEEAVVKIPDYLSYEEAASLPCAAVSAWNALTDRQSLQPGQTVLVLGTGGVSLFALQISRMFGARVIATTSSAAKAEKLRTLGAAVVLNYRETTDWDGAVLQHTDGLGVDRVVEVGGAGTINRSIACTRAGGHIGLVGFVSGFGATLDPVSVLGRGITLKGIGIGSRVQFESLLRAMSAHQIRPVIDRVFAFEDFRTAFQLLDAGTYVGKILIKID